jgi:hypothetical protein
MVLIISSLLTFAVELRTGCETLEDVFVRVVGADPPAETLDWL